MDGIQPIFDEAKKQLDTLRKAKESGDEFLANGAATYLKTTLKTLDQIEVDEKYADQVAEIRQAIG